MKSLILFFTMTVALGWAQEGTQNGVTLTITLENVLNDQGDILAALHTRDTFMKGPGTANYQSPAQKGQMTFTFNNVNPGTYGVSVLHDLNSNQRMDYESNGMPTEPYGMSGNDMSMGPPSFDAVSFEVGTADQDITIRF
jgi:uncharacterized protein (DUF2141 family)